MDAEDRSILYGTVFRLDSRAFALAPGSRVKPTRAKPLSRDRLPPFPGLRPGASTSERLRIAPEFRE